MVILSVKARLLTIRLIEKQKSNVDIFNKICVVIKTENDNKFNKMNASYSVHLSQHTPKLNEVSPEHDFKRLDN